MRPRKCTILIDAVDHGDRLNQKRRKAPRNKLREEIMSDAKKLSSLDASFLYLETPGNADARRKHGDLPPARGLQGRLLRRVQGDDIVAIAHRADHESARKAPDIDHPSWVEDDQFDIDRHIFRSSLPAPHDRATLERIVGWMHAKL